jgi:hypothetical protein
MSCRSVPDGERVPLASVVAGTHFTLVGLGPVGSHALARCAEAARAALQNDVGVVALAESAQTDSAQTDSAQAEAPWADWTLVDPAGAAARALGLAVPSVVLVRPDGLLAWSGPADAEQLAAKLRTVARLAEPLRALPIAL